MSEQTGKMIISRRAVIAKIEAHFAGQLSATALAQWAFDRFYAEELGSEIYQGDAENEIAEALDALMFSNDVGFTLTPQELQRLIEQLA